MTNADGCTFAFKTLRMYWRWQTHSATADLVQTTMNCRRIMVVERKDYGGSGGRGGASQRGIWAGFRKTDEFKLKVGDSLSWRRERNEPRPRWTQTSGTEGAPRAPNLEQEISISGLWLRNPRQLHQPDAHLEKLKSPCCFSPKLMPGRSSRTPYEKPVGTEIPRTEGPAPPSSARLGIHTRS